MAMPPKRLASWTEDDVDPDVLARYNEVVRNLRSIFETNDPIENGAPYAIPLSLAAKTAWIDFFNRHAAESEQLTDPNLAAAIAKIRGYAARIALVLALTSSAHDGPEAASGLSEINVQSIESAIRITEWLKHETRRIYGSFTANRKVDELAKILGKIREKGGAITARELQRSNQRRYGQGRANELLDQLAEAGLVERVVEEPGPQGGRPRETYRLVDPDNDLNHDTSDNSDHQQGDANDMTGHAQENAQ